jgi:hypothetical protein
MVAPGNKYFDQGLGSSVLSRVFSLVPCVLDSCDN